MPLLEAATRRRLVGRLERGEELCRTVGDAALRHGVQEGEVRAYGRMDWAQIAGFGPDVTTRVEGPFDVVSLQGRISVVNGKVDFSLAIHAVPVAPGRPALTGRLLGAGAAGLDVVLEVWEMVEVGTTRPDAPAKVAAATPESPRKAAWAKVVEASRRRPEPDPLPELDLPTSPPRTGGTLDLDGPAPEVGDYVDHPQFGRCRVVESADDRLGIRLASGRIVQLGTSVLSFGEAKVDDGQRVFPVSVKARR